MSSDESSDNEDGGNRHSLASEFSQLTSLIPNYMAPAACWVKKLQLVLKHIHYKPAQAIDVVKAKLPPHIFARVCEWTQPDIKKFLEAIIALEAMPKEAA